MTSESLLIWEEENHKQATDEVYKDLVAAIEQLRENCTRQTLDDYRVIWATPERDYGTTTYTVTGFEEELGETKMKIRGGERRII
jgi:hypothetical protein